jgi:hypothetical protein
MNACSLPPVKSTGIPKKELGFASSRLKYTDHALDGLI